VYDALPVGSFGCLPREMVCRLGPAPPSRQRADKNRPEQAEPRKKAREASDARGGPEVPAVPPQEEEEGVEWRVESRFLPHGPLAPPPEVAPGVVGLTQEAVTVALDALSVPHHTGSPNQPSQPSHEATPAGGGITATPSPEELEGNTMIFCVEDIPIGEHC